MEMKLAESDDTRCNGQRKRIPIFFSFDDRYVNPAAVAFFSLLNRAHEGVHYEMFVLHHDITAEHQDLLRRIVNERGNGTLTFVDTGGFLSAEWSGGNWGGSQFGARFTANTVIRCFAARFFPQYDKIVYSDVDVVFADDVSELIDFDLGDAYFAGVRSVVAKFWREELSHLKPEHYEILKDRYVGAGIWVVDLAKIRRDRIEDRMMEIVRDDTIVKKWPDQDVMNIACAEHVKFLPLNYVALPFLPRLMAQPGFVSHYTRDELYDSLLRPKILHYAADKPWSTRMDWDCDWWNIADYLKLDCSRERREVMMLPEVAAEIKTLKRQKRRWRFLMILASLTAAVSLVCLIAFVVGRS